MIPTSLEANEGMSPEKEGDSRHHTCKSCGSERLREFNGEIAIHFPGLAGLDQPIVWVFPKLSVCLSCGTAEFIVPDEQLDVLAKGKAAAG